MSDYSVIYTEHTSPVELEPEPIQPRPWWKKTLHWFIALVFILAMVYLYGAQQFVQFQRTPADSAVGEYETLLTNAVSVDIPTKVFVITRDNSIDTERVENLVVKANKILAQASVSMRVVAIEPVSVPADQPIGPQLVNDRAVLQKLLPPLADNELHVVLVDGLGGINGIAFSGQRLVAVAEYTTSFDFRVLAHEVGHALTLGHVDDRGNLMYSGSSSTMLTKEQAEAAYAAAEAYYQSGS